LTTEGVDGFVCVGDLVGYGPHPNEAVNRIGEMGMPCVLGNHDQVVATGEGMDRVNDLARATLTWTQDVIAEDALDYLRSLPIRRDLEGGVVLAHGSLNDPWTYVRRPPDAWNELEHLENGDGILFLGHTHRQYVVSRGRPASATSAGIVARSRRVSLRGHRSWTVNPGAVGQSREWRPLARFALLDLERRDVTLFAGRYPVAETSRALIATGLPADACHARPTVKKVLRQAARDFRDRRTADAD
jgi:predicted phosphodiesterase